MDEDIVPSSIHQTVKTVQKMMQNKWVSSYFPLLNVICFWEPENTTTSRVNIRGRNSRLWEITYLCVYRNALPLIHMPIPYWKQRKNYKSSGGNFNWQWGMITIYTSFTDYKSIADPNNPKRPNIFSDQILYVLFNVCDNTQACNICDSELTE